MAHIFGGNSPAGIADNHLHFGADGAADNAQGATLRHGLVGIADQIKDGLLHLLRVNRNVGQVRVKAAHKLDGVVNPVFITIFRPGHFNHIVEIGGAGLVIALAGEVEQTLDNLLAMQGFLL